MLHAVPSGGGRVEGAPPPDLRQFEVLHMHGKREFRHPDSEGGRPSKDVVAGNDSGVVASPHL